MLIPSTLLESQLLLITEINFNKKCTSIERKKKWQCIYVSYFFSLSLSSHFLFIFLSLLVSLVGNKFSCCNCDEIEKRKKRNARGGTIHCKIALTKLTKITVHVNQMHWSKLNCGREAKKILVGIFNGQWCRKFISKL